MKLIHTADWHLGNSFHGHQRQDEFQHFLDWLLEQLRLNRPDALVVAGDVFDSANPPAAAEQLLYDFLLRATTDVKDLQVVVVAGNHDSAGRLEAPAELLHRFNIYVRGTIRRNEESDEPDFDHYILPLGTLGSTEAEVVCFALPYLRPSDYPAGMTVGEGIKWYLDNMVRLHRKSDFRKLPVVVAGHFYAAGAEVCENEHSERLVVGGQDCVAAGSVDCGAAYTALGHIHKAQRVADAKGEMYYAGSALPMSFSEKRYSHGVQLVEIDDAGGVNVKRLEYSPLRGLLGIPDNGAASPAEVLDAIDTLPRRTKDDDGCTWPYLEIRVRETSPEPSLLHSVTEALEDRAVHFCRMVREVPASKKSVAEISSLESLRQLSPMEIALRIYGDSYANPMPDGMRTRLEEAITAAVEEDADK
ncbi:MAG: exonuclease SbcCD subunit D [Bacteroidales bacterium]|nr:exonuclease SbcCD subunit D [Bacteroidales bacterium]